MAHGGQGRTVSWISVLVICLGFTIGGIGLCLDPHWWMFWVGVGITVAGGALAMATGILEDYSTEGH